MNRTPHDTTRADRAVLRSPVRLDSGSVRYDAILTSAGTRLRYAHGEETVAAEALEDPDYLEALRGVPVILDPDLHWPGVSVDADGAAIVGTVTRADYQDGAQIVEMTLHAPDAIKWIEDHKDGPDRPGVSVRYDVAEMDDTGTVQRRRRAPNHVLLTLHPRDTTARIRADEDTMTPDEIREAVSPLFEHIAEALKEMGGRMDAMREEIKADGYHEKADNKHYDEDEKADDMHEDKDPRADSYRARVHAVEKIARVKGIELPADATLSACESLVMESLSLRADGLDAPAYLAALSHLVDEVPTETPAPRADGLRGRPVHVQTPATPSSVDDIFSTL